MTPEQLYQHLIVEHDRHPRYAGPLSAPTHAASDINPLCGDSLSLGLEVKEGRVLAMGCDAQGCALSRAAASIMSEVVVGMSTADAQALSLRFIEDLQEEQEAHEEAAQGEGDLWNCQGLRALRAVRAFPYRTGCVCLAWRTLLSALGSLGGEAAGSGG